MWDTKKHQLWISITSRKQHTRCVRKVPDLRSYLRFGAILRHPDRGILRSSTHLIKPLSFERHYNFGNIQKSQGAMSELHGGWRSCTILCFDKNCCTTISECAGALSWWRSQSPLDQKRGRFLLTASRNHFRNST